MVGGKYLFEDYIEIRVYGFEQPPYPFPLFIPMRIFSLDFIKHSLKIDKFHFVLAKKGYISSSQ